MRKILYSALSLFVVWFASTACFPIYVGSSRPQLAPCQVSSNDPNIPCDATGPVSPQTPLPEVAEPTNPGETKMP